VTQNLIDRLLHQFFLAKSVNVGKFCGDESLLPKGRVVLHGQPKERKKACLKECKSWNNQDCELSAGKGKSPEGRNEDSPLEPQ
jgi:hypothetical protein